MGRLEFKGRGRVLGCWELEFYSYYENGESRNSTKSDVSQGLLGIVSKKEVLTVF